LATPDMSPWEFAPSVQHQLEWPKWGQYRETKGKVGEPPDLPGAVRLLELFNSWLNAGTGAEHAAIWHETLRIWADEVFSIGLIGISLLIFIISHLPPGDYFSTYIAELQSQGEQAILAKIDFLKAQYGFDLPLWQQYIFWVVGLIQGDMGYSFLYDLPVNKVVGDRLFLTFLVSFTTIIFTYLVAFPIGVYSATHQYSISDYLLTFIGFLGLATPSFLLALLLVYFANVYFGISVGGLMDPRYVDAPWSLPKAISVLAHIWIPVIVIGTAGTASMIRRLRANLLDELQKQSVV